MSIQVSVVWVAACLPVLPDAPFTFTAHIRAARPAHAPAKKTAYAYDNRGACLRAILMGLGEAIQHFSNPVIPPLYTYPGS